MQFHALALRGFRSFRESCELALSPDLSGGLVYVTGENKVEPSLGANGIGKSTLFDALHWALYGKTSRNLRASEVADWSSPDDGCEVTVRFDDHTLCRTWNPNSLTLDGTVVEQPVLEATVGLSEEAFLSAVYHAQFVPHFADRGPTAQLDIFSDALRLDVWERAAARASGVMRESERDLSTLQQRVGLARGAYSEAKARLDELESKELNWWRSHVDKMRDTQIELRTAQEKLDGAVEAVKASPKSEGALDATVGATTLQRLRVDLSLALATRTEAYDKSELLTGATCPTCMQPIEEVQAREFWEKIARKATVAGAKLTGEIKRLEARVKRDELQRRQEMQAVAKRSGQLRERVDRYRETVGRLKRELRQLADTECPYDSEALVERCGTLAIALEEARAAERETRLKITNHEFWIKGFRQIRLELVDTALAQFELSTNNALAQLGLVDWMITYDVQSETKKGTIHSAFTINVQSPYNDRAVPFHAWSGGESQRLRLAITLGLSDVIQDFTGSQTNLEIFDEPTAWLSAEGIGSLLDVLANRARESDRTIMLADHRVIESTVFTERLKIVKDEKGSHICV